MSILDYAIQMERDGYEFYTLSAERIRDRAAKRMLESLAEDEKRHEQILEELKSGTAIMVETDTFVGIMNVYQELALGETPFFCDSDALSDVLHKGVEAEKRSEQLYHDMCLKAYDQAEREVWHKLEEEECKHEKLLELTLDYIDQPNIVLENAEFLFYDHDITP